MGEVWGFLIWTGAVSFFLGGGAKWGIDFSVSVSYCVASATGSMDLMFVENECMKILFDQQHRLLINYYYLLDQKVFNY